MKKILLFSTLVFTHALTFADPPGPPGPGGDPGGSGGVPVGSPIDNTTIILLVLAFCYGVWKIVEFRRKSAAGWTEKEPGRIT